MGLHLDHSERNSFVRLVGLMYRTDLIDIRYHVIQWYTIYINVHRFTNYIWRSLCKVPFILVRF
jgi:hypothetical protein